MDRQPNAQEELDVLMDKHEAGVADVLRAYVPVEEQYVAASNALAPPVATYVAANTSPTA